MYLQEAKNILRELKLNQLANKASVGLRNALTNKSVLKAIENDRKVASKWRKVANSGIAAIHNGGDTIVPKAEKFRAMAKAKVGAKFERINRGVRAGVGATGASLIGLGAFNDAKKVINKDSEKKS